MKKPFRLLIAVPSTGIMAADFVKSLIQLTEHLQHEGIAHNIGLRQIRFPRAPRRFRYL